VNAAEESNYLNLIGQAPPRVFKYCGASHNFFLPSCKTGKSKVVKTHHATVDNSAGIFRSDAANV
jgi:hypothetical protein